MSMYNSRKYTVDQIIKKCGISRGRLYQEISAENKRYNEAMDTALALYNSGDYSVNMAAESAGVAVNNLRKAIENQGDGVERTIITPEIIKGMESDNI